MSSCVLQLCLSVDPFNNFTFLLLLVASLNKKLARAVHSDFKPEKEEPCFKATICGSFNNKRVHACLSDIIALGQDIFCLIKQK